MCAEGHQPAHPEASEEPDRGPPVAVEKRIHAHPTQNNEKTMRKGKIGPRGRCTTETNDPAGTGSNARPHTTLGLPAGRGVRGGGAGGGRGGAPVRGRRRGGGGGGGHRGGA